MSVSGQIYGVGITLEADDKRTLAQMLEWLPPAWRANQPGVAQAHFRIGLEGSDAYYLQRDGERAAFGAHATVFEVFDWLMRNHIVVSAPHHIFVHAGVVSTGGKAILVPGASFSGKTTLVAALVRGGAAYYSDEYAVLDAAGLVHPYPKPLSMRLDGDDRGQTRYDIDELGGVAGTEPAPIGVVAFAQYHPGSEWRPLELSPSEAVLELMQHTFPVRERLAPALAALSMALERATVVKGERGEASEMVDDLLQRVAQSPS